MFRLLFPLAFAVACGSPTPESPAMPAAPPEAPARAVRPPPSADKAPEEKTVADIAVGSPDHTTLVAALQAAGLVDALASPGGVYTVFAPTNAAFDKLPPGTVEGLLKPEALNDLKKVLKHHAMVPVKLPADLHDGEELTMSDGSNVTVHVEGTGDAAKITVSSGTAAAVNVVGSVRGMNGIVYVVDGVLLPPS